VEIVNVLNSTHFHEAHNNQWVSVAGCMHLVNLNESAKVEVTGHCHANVLSGDRRCDFGVFIDGNFNGIAGEGENRVGMGLSNTPYWVPMVCVANAQLRSGPHVIELKISNGGIAGLINFNGVGMSIKFFYEVEL